VIGREQGPGHDRFHRRSSSSRRRTDRGEQARGYLRSLELGDDRLRFRITRWQPGQRLLQYTIEKSPNRPCLAIASARVPKAISGNQEILNPESQQGITTLRRVSIL
jgi:hypothetical protein